MALFSKPKRKFWSKGFSVKRHASQTKILGANTQIET